VFESEALSQFILHQHPYLLMDKDFVLVCDFGGHFMVSTEWVLKAYKARGVQC